jgi:hypothetical protein
MKPSMLAVIATLGICVGAARAADATSPVDYTQRNGPFAPAEGPATSKKKPAINEIVQEKRVDKATVEKQKSSLRERQAAIDVIEMRSKQVREKESHRPEAIETATSDFNQRQSRIATMSDTIKPPLVAKYQDSLTTAPTWPGVRAMDPAAKVKINRFVFRKNPPEPTPAPSGHPVTSAAGGSVLQK